MTTQLTESSEEYIVDGASIQPEVRICLIVVYMAICCLCFLGNLTVVIVATLEWRARSMVSFCMGKLAFSNLCVAILCTYQNFSTFFHENWIFGTLFCRMYYLTSSLSYTASTLILIVMCTERYLSIACPSRCQLMRTVQRLRLIAAMLWFVSALISAPRLYFISILDVPFPSIYTKGEGEVACVQALFNSKMVDMVTFVLLFIVPLFVMSVLYAKICRIVWHNSEAVHQSIPPKQHVSELTSTDGGLAVEVVPTAVQIREMPRVSHNSLVTEDCADSYKFGNRHFPPSLTFMSSNHTRGKLSSEPAPKIPSCRSSRSGQQERRAPYRCASSSAAKGRSVRSDGSQSVTKNASKCVKAKTDREFGLNHELQDVIYRSVTVEERVDRANHTQSHQLDRMPRLAALRVKDKRHGQALNSRQGVIRMLIVILITFALCNLPYHLRKICRNYVPNYNVQSTANQIITPITFLLVYTNCALTPIVYVFMSKSFRSSLRALLRFKQKRPNDVQRSS